jgi:glycosyltransferase involved in cell wall biosynthesis
MKASVIVISHNHENFIHDCLRSIITQNVNFNFEIIWCDDASSDHTIEIGEAVLKEWNGVIKRVHYKNNRLSKKISYLLDCIELVQGEFVFHIEGDDYWLFDGKMVLQVNSLESNFNSDICFTPAKIVENKTETEKTLNRYSDKPLLIPVNEVINGDGGFMPTSSLCIRKTVFDTAPNWLYSYLPVGDYPMQVVSSLRGGAIFLPAVTTAYRMNTGNSWTDRIANKDEKKIIFEIDFIALIQMMRDGLDVDGKFFDKILRRHLASAINLSFKLNKIDLLKKICNTLRETL